MPFAAPARRPVGLAGHTPVVFTALAPATPQIKAGNARARGHGGEAQSPALPDVPTMAEAGFAGSGSATHRRLLVPAGTPQAIIDLLHGEIVAARRACRTSSAVAAHRLQGGRQHAGEFAALIKAEGPKWGKVIRDAQYQVAVGNAVIPGRRHQRVYARLRCAMAGPGMTAESFSAGR